MYYIFSNNNTLWSSIQDNNKTNTTVVGGEAKHTFLVPDSSEESAEPVSAQADELAA